MKTYVYFIQMGTTGPVKIGKAGSANSVRRRLSAIQTTCPEPVFLRAAIEGEEETSIHQMFASDRLRGEWFMPSSELMSFMDKAQPTAESGLPTAPLPRAMKMSGKDAQRYWMNDRLELNEAIAHMHGWTMAAARIAFGPRPKVSILTDATREKKSRAGTIGAEVTKANSLVRLWRSTAMADEREAARLHWCDPEHRDKPTKRWLLARAKLPKQLQVLKYTSLWRIFGGQDGAQSKRKKRRGRPRSTE